MSMNQLLLKFIVRLQHVENVPDYLEGKNVAREQSKGGEGQIVAIEVQRLIEPGPVAVPRQYDHAYTQEYCDEDGIDSLEKQTVAIVMILEEPAQLQ